MSRLFCVNRSLRYKDSIVSLAYLLVWLFISSNKLSGRRRWKKSEKERFSGSCTRRKHLITCEVEPLARLSGANNSVVFFAFSFRYCSLNRSRHLPLRCFLNRFFLHLHRYPLPQKLVIDILFAYRHDSSRHLCLQKFPRTECYANSFF